MDQHCMIQTALISKVANLIVSNPTDK